MGEVKGGCPLLFPLVPTYLLAAMHKFFGADLTALCLPPSTMQVENLTLRNVLISHSRVTPIVFFGGVQDITVENLTVVDTHSTGAFPYSANAACYNPTVHLKVTS